ncbi:FG-GAP-like repeat-containing protein [Bradyrhizobium yuanmingense]|uniref:FG-GAP-like repeat-containing protein n=1 Tax=Bradyrhizobium yuanmingense TaxID=108015 RepID=UPI0023BA2789|nr:FG-GAP-like repeat-containing protein [Bradyrhizobium yuanmingense]MDF0584147.1 FG-GAP-like repeat-containing protein [Bradyrhizobium yuanmingense]
MSLTSSRRPLRTFRYALVALLSVGLAMPGSTSSLAGTMSLPGSFSVSPTGGATYSIPIALPPGTAGMAPTLSLEYSSQGANGLLGLGWSLSGLPSITRCGRTFAQDGVSSGVGFGIDDKFCMDGQRLVAVNGAYGADGTEYRTEVEAFSKIIAHGSGSGPDWFEVHTKSGQVLEFGHSVDSSIKPAGRAGSLIWALSKTSDTKGNYFTVSYNVDTANGQYWPTRIDYTGNSAASLAPYNSVQFVYATRPDYVLMYQYGGRNKTTVRMTNVKTYAGSALVSDYRLAYQQSPSSSRSELISVTACGADGTCLPASTFQWATGGGAPSWVHGGGANPNGWNFGWPGPANGYFTVSGDFNGDGKADIVQVAASTHYVMLSNGDGTFTGAGPYQNPYGWNFSDPPNKQYSILSGDFDGDGKTDFALLNGTAYYVFQSNGNGTFAGLGGFLYSGGLNFGNPPHALYTPFTGDFNGDGRTDFALMNGTNYWTFLSNGNGTFATTAAVNPNNWNFGSSVPVLVTSNGMNMNTTSTTSGYDTFSGDFDGDGKTDLALICDMYYYVMLSNGDGTFRGVSGVYDGGSNFGNPPSKLYAIFVGDLNGDGKTDFSLVSGAHYWSFLSKGDGTFTENGTTNPNGWVFNSPPALATVTFSGDFNGDGRTDLALAGNNHYYFFISNGDGTFSGAAGGLYTGGATFGDPPSYLAIAGDYNGDGRTDLAMLGGTWTWIETATGTLADVVTMVSSGLGATVNVTYAPLTNSSVYSKANNASYPTQDVQGPMYVVSHVATSNGVGGTYSSAYDYSWAKLDLRGRGFLGFGQTSVKDLQTNIVDTTNYRQDFPYIGLVSSTVRVVAGGQTLGQSTNSYQFTNAGGGGSISTASVTSAPYKVSLSQNVSSGADLDGSALPTVTTSNQYDAYLNATQVVVSTPDGFSKTTTNTYTNDPSLWYLGRLTRATVTNVAP